MRQRVVGLRAMPVNIVPLPPVNPDEAPGFSLVELLVTSVVALLVLTGVVHLYVETIKSNASTIEAARLDQDLHAAMDVITRSLRRTGFWGQTVQSLATGTLHNPFMHVQTGIQIDRSPGEAMGTCILFSYDRDANASVEANEQMGFRLHEQSLEMRQDGRKCSQSHWSDITDPNLVRITHLRFEKHEQVYPFESLEIRQQIINITLSAHLLSDPVVSLTLRGAVHIQNDPFRI